MRLDAIKTGLRVVITKLKGTDGILVTAEHLNVRKIGLTGTIKGHVPGHGGDAWWIQHDKSGKIGAYMFTEFEPIKKLKKRQIHKKSVAMTIVIGKRQYEDLKSITHEHKKPLDRLIKEAIENLIQKY